MLDRHALPTLPVPLVPVSMTAIIRKEKKHPLFQEGDGGTPKAITSPEQKGNALFPGATTTNGLERRVSFDLQPMHGESFLESHRSRKHDINLKEASVPGQFERRSRDGFHRIPVERKDDEQIDSKDSESEDSQNHKG